MRKIQFTEHRDFDYGEGTVHHAPGDVAELRDDKAQRWVTRKVAFYVSDDAVVGAAPVEGADGVGAGVGSVDEPAHRAKSAPKRAPGRSHK